MSLKQRLLAVVLTAVSLAWLGAALITYLDARHELDELLDAHLAQASTLLIAQSAEELDDIEAEHAPLLHEYSRDIAFQLWDKHQQLRFHSANAPSQPLADHQQGFSTTSINGYTWRVFSMWNHEQDLLIHVAERMDMRQHLAQDITERLLLPLALTLPILAILLWWLIGKGLSPLLRLTQALTQRSANNLSPISLQAPSEVAPLIMRLNQLFTRISDLIEQERRFTADAAHELRTPIAGIQAQVQVAQAVQHTRERQNALTNALQGCQRATHLISQLLTLARLESYSQAQWVMCDLVSLSQQTLAELAPQDHSQQHQLELCELNVPVYVQGLPTLLQVLLRNVLDNALRYTSAGTSIQVCVLQQNKQVIWQIADNGQGLAEAELAKISQRFYRALGTQASGSGLGLSIVQRIANIHQANLSIRNRATSSGLVVEIVFEQAT
jgi:two-component system sensor histidine kinase QseC